MKLRKRNAFTLIELVAVLVIMAIIALIATPLVMNIIRSARASADKRSVDAYGRSIELAIAGYLLDNGRFPTQVSELTIEYSGNEVVCETTQLNSDSSVYLAGCIVAGRSTGDYTYGTEEVITYDAYSVGDEVTYNNVDYRVIKDSSAQESAVTLLKSEPLTVAEVNQYGIGHVNRYTESSVGTASDDNGYGGLAYYTSETCGKVNNNFVSTGCTTDYAQSEVKYVVDTWKNVEAPEASEARLITYDELEDNLGFDHGIPEASWINANPEYTPSWVYNSNYRYWTMSPYNDSSLFVWKVRYNGELYQGIDIKSSGGAVRPVIVLPKSALQ